MRFEPGSGARYRINTVGGTVLLDDMTIKGMLGKGFERVVGELAGRWLELGANSVSGSISIMRREAPANAGTADAAAGTRRGRRRGLGMTPPVFAHGNLRLYLLALLEERPRHGYELIQALSDRFGGTYSPSAGTIYPRLSKLEEEGLVTKSTDGRKTVYEITDAGAPSSTRAATSSTPSRTTSPTPCAASPTACAPR